MKTAFGLVLVFVFAAFVVPWRVRRDQLAAEVKEVEDRIFRLRASIAATNRSDLAERLLRFQLVAAEVDLNRARGYMGEPRVEDKATEALGSALAKCTAVATA